MMFEPAGALFRRFPWFAVLVGAVLAARAACGLAQERADDDPFLPGLVASFRDADGNTASRVDPQLAFHWTETGPDPRLAAGEFRGTWQGHLLVGARGDHRFFVFASGQVELKIAGKVVVPRQVLRNEWRESPSVPLAAEYLALELSFRRTETDARLMVLWSGPQFGPEPVPPRLLFHERQRSPGYAFERGRLLSRALRCGHCHGGEQPSQPAPALDRLTGNLSREWLAGWLAAGEHPGPRPGNRPDQGEPVAPRRMPAFGLSTAQAEAVADWLLAPRGSNDPEPALPREEKAPGGDRKRGSAPPKPNAQSGERLFLTLGCVACHTWRDLGGGGWFGGGDLTHVADKRPPGFFAAWLADPARLNRDHRMPVFSLSDGERASLALFLAEQKSGASKATFSSQDSAERRARGQKLVEQFRCGACHRLPESPGTPQAWERLAPRLGARSDWKHSCVGDPDPAKPRPGYHLSEDDARALRQFYISCRAQPPSPLPLSPHGNEVRGEGGRPAPPDGQLLLVEHNCLACHAREGTHDTSPLLPPLLADKLTAVASRYPDLAPLVPALTPPTLTSAGDKLTDQALVEVIARRGEPHRPYLEVRMPRFPLRDEEVRALVHDLVAADRVPPRGPGPAQPANQTQMDRYALAGGRLVSSDGFGCTSCHQVGSVHPTQAPLNARGPNMALLERRIRREWFDRWVRNPARIVPRMEMPSVQIPVSGVLDEQLDEQLAAVWHVLNLPGFEPPQPNPIRTLRQHGNHPGAEPVLITDVLQYRDKTLIKPFLVGLANRHNVLIDLEAGGLALWTLGDTGRQRTKGKTWFWELAGAPVLDTGITGPDLSLIAGGREHSAQLRGQFVTEADAWWTEGPCLGLRYRLTFPIPAKQGAQTNAVTLQVQRRLSPLAPDQPNPVSGFAQELSAGALPGSAKLRLQMLSPQVAAGATLSSDGRVIRLGDRFASRIVLREPADLRFSADRTGLLLAPDEKGEVRLVLNYLSEAPVDRFPELPLAEAVARKGEAVDIAPGFLGERLPLPAEIMPSALTWRPDGRLVFTSLKGQVFEAVDTDHDGSEDRLALLADGLPTPYGAHAGPGYVDVSAKYALLRVWDPRPAPLTPPSPSAGGEGGVRGGRRVEAIASGWGYTQDYHDWAVGLPRNARGEYFLGIPCQQDKRSAAAARFHGNVLRLVPRQPTPQDPRLFALEPVSAGHRFPMGLALNRDGELFVTDNQGNYNPFNELNHVRPGAHFGFINALDRGQPAPPLTPPAIDIPHPWTRSVNGICFLYTPKELRAKLGRDVFGSLEGHLIGCEYDTRRLVRMTLQRVGHTFQGAAYPLSLPPRDPAHGFWGPVVCAVSPRGELYVGSIRDSGWGAGNNIGEVVRVRVELDQLPCGIAEVRAVRDGFVLDFIRPVDPGLAGRAENYAVTSYRRVATPAYGGPDVDRRGEKVTGVQVAADARRVTLTLAELRPGFVYEFRLKNLAPGGEEFHPAETHYTLRVLPK